MLTIHMSEPDILAIEFFRVAISEESLSARRKALLCLQQQLEIWKISGLRQSAVWVSGLLNPTEEFSRWMVDTNDHRSESAYEFGETCSRYEKKFERKLNIAEQVGDLVWRSIGDGTFKGLHTPRGILQVVQAEARASNIRGGKDKDVLRKLWKTYRGVVHLGIAMDFCESYEIEGPVVLEVAEEIRWQLLNNGPKGAGKPYVDEAEQISFVFKSIE